MICNSYLGVAVQQNVQVDLSLRCTLHEAGMLYSQEINNSDDD